MEPGDLQKSSDYRAFLRAAAPTSLRALSAAMGASEAYLKHVLAGTRNLTADRAVALAATLQLGSEDSAYFVTLVLRDNAETDAAYAHFDRALAEMRQKALTYAATRRMPTVFSDALLWEVYTLISADGFRPDPAWIAAKLARPGAGEAAVARALKRLVELKAVSVGGDGAYKAADVVLRDGALVRGVYRTALKRAIQHLDDVAPGPGEAFDAFCLVLSEGEFAAAKAVMAEAKAKIAELVRRTNSVKSKGKSRISYYNAQLFWASR